MHRTLPGNVQTRIRYTGTKLGTRFNNIKDPVKKSHDHDVAYYATCLNQAVQKAALVKQVED